MYNLKPVFIGNTEKEVLFRMCSVLGTPNNTNWPEGINLAKKIDLKFPASSGTILSQIVPEASKDALDFISEMVKWDPNKRSTAISLLQHQFFTSGLVPNRISTPEYINKFNASGKKVKSYSNNPQKKFFDKDMSSVDPTKKDDNEFIKLLDDTKGFNECNFLFKI
jgi:serine/threonine protein kinase